MSSVRRLWKKILEAADEDLVRELVHSLKAEEAEAICGRGIAAVAAYALPRAEPPDLLAFLEMDARPAVLWRGDERVMEGELLEIAFHVEEHPDPGYRLELVGAAEPVAR